MREIDNCCGTTCNKKLALEDFEQLIKANAELIKQNDKLIRDNKKYLKKIARFTEVKHGRSDQFQPLSESASAENAVRSALLHSAEMPSFTVQDERDVKRFEALRGLAEAMFGDIIISSIGSTVAVAQPQIDAVFDALVAEQTGLKGEARARFMKSIEIIRTVMREMT